MVCPLGPFGITTSDTSECHEVWKVSSTWSTGMNGAESLRIRQQHPAPLALKGPNSEADPGFSALPKQLLLTVNALLISGYTGYAESAGIEIEEIRLETTGRFRADIATEWFRTPSEKMGSIRYIACLRSKGSISRISTIHNRVKAALTAGIFRPEIVSIHSQLLVR